MNLKSLDESCNKIKERESESDFSIENSSL